MNEYFVLVVNPGTQSKFQVISKHTLRKGDISTGKIYLEGELLDTFATYKEAVDYIREIE